MPGQTVAPRGLDLPRFLRSCAAPAPRRVVSVIANKYLAYYLTRPDRWFDEAQVMAAFTHADVQHGTTHAREVLRRSSSSAPCPRYQPPHTMNHP